MWSWLAYMNPQRLTWGARFFPGSMAVAIATLLGFVLTKDRQKLPMERETVLLILLWITYTITSFFGLSLDVWNAWSRTSKILLFTLLTITLCTDREKLRYLLLTIGLSVGFFGFKGGIFSLITGGNDLVMGPGDTFFGENNTVGLALSMVLPIIYYQAKEEANKKLKMVLRAVFAASFVAILCTHSRGAFLALSVSIFMFLIKSRQKLLTAVLVIVGICFALFFLPDKWFERMESMKDYEQDGSAMGRINAWQFAVNLALDRPLTGGGFKTFTRELFKIYAPKPTDVHDSHSIYFQVLAEHGFIGFGLYIMTMMCTLLSMRKIKKIHINYPSHSWICSYCDMINISICTFMVGGAFLGLAHFDLYYHMIAIAIIIKVLSNKELSILNSSIYKEQMSSESRYAIQNV